LWNCHFVLFLADLRSPEMLSYVVEKAVSHISTDHTAIIFRVKQSLKTWISSNNIVTASNFTSYFKDSWILKLSDVSGTFLTQNVFCSVSKNYTYSVFILQSTKMFSFIVIIVQIIFCYLIAHPNLMLSLATKCFLHHRIRTSTVWLWTSGTVALQWVG